MKNISTIAIIIIITLILLAIILPSMLKDEDKYNFRKCKNRLVLVGHIYTGKISPNDEYYACGDSHISDIRKCIPSIEKYIGEYCMINTFKKTNMGNNKYEVYAKPIKQNNNNNNCYICATEVEVNPLLYERCGYTSEPVCIH